MKRSTDAPSGQWLDADALKVIPVGTVLQHYGLLENRVDRGPTASGPSPFNEGSTMSLNHLKNVWNDSGGRPQVGGERVPGNVIGLVQAIEKVSFRQALEILHRRFAVPAQAETQNQAHQAQRGQVAAVLRQEAVQAKAEGNTPFGKELKGLKADVPFLREAGVSPAMAKDWGVGWCSRGLLRSRIAFPIRSLEGTIMAYTGLSPQEEAPEGRWKFPSGFQRSLELFGIDRILGDPGVLQVAREEGLTLVSDPLQVLQIVRERICAVVSPMGAELSEQQLEVLLDPRLNPSTRITLHADDAHRRAWATVLIRHAWVRYQNPDEPTS